MKQTSFFFSFLLLVVISLTSAQAAETKNLGKFGNWHAYKKGDVCYMVSMAKSSAGNYTKRGDVYAVVTHRPKQNSKDVLSLHAGYPFGKGAQVNATVVSKSGNKSETLFTEGEIAWCMDSKTDSEMVNYMSKKGSELVVKGKSARGTATTDKYSLSGMLAAYKAICKACNIT